MVVRGDELACPKMEEPKKKLGHEFPHGQTALAVPSDNQKTMSQIDPGGRVGGYGWREGGLPIITHVHHLWLIHECWKIVGRINMNHHRSSVDMTWNPT